jgi:branched-chain amino acid transport system ATP-binding protein
LYLNYAAVDPVLTNDKCSFWLFGRPATVMRSGRTSTTCLKCASRTAQILQDINPVSRLDVPAGLLAYAEQRTLEIGITIAGGADVILLDEPTAGISHVETERAVALIGRLTESRTLLIIEHDMSVVFGLADRISVLVYGQIIASGTPEEIRGNPKVKEGYLGPEAA